jgi:hypothetical protein
MAGVPAKSRGPNYGATPASRSSSCQLTQVHESCIVIGCIGGHTGHNASALQINADNHQAACEVAEKMHGDSPVLRSLPSLPCS